MSESGSEGVPGGRICENVEALSWQVGNQGKTTPKSKNECKPIYRKKQHKQKQSKKKCQQNKKNKNATKNISALLCGCSYLLVSSSSSLLLLSLSLFLIIFLCVFVCYFMFLEFSTILGIRITCLSGSVCVYCFCFHFHVLLLVLLSILLLVFPFYSVRIGLTGVLLFQNCQLFLFAVVFLIFLRRKKRSGFLVH